jgi:hypothetical protein
VSALFPSLALAAWLGVPLYALRARGRPYALFGFLLLSFALPGALATHARLSGWVAPGLRPGLDAAFAWGMAAAALHLAHLVRARLRGPAFRLGVSLPGQAFLAAGFLAGVWQLALLPVRGVLALAGAEAALAWLRPLDLLPLLVAALSVVTSARLGLEWVEVRLGGDGPVGLRRLPARRRRVRAPEPRERRALRVVQIADPHLGPWQPVARLRASLERLLACDPDLVLLTGDFLTMESHGSPGALARALAPLVRVPDRCFAVFGNHDHEAPDEVRAGLAETGVRLLVDEEAVVATPAGPVQLLGADYVRRGRRRHLAELAARFPRRPGHGRLLLLHDPSGFVHLPPGEVDLALCGHTHGGQFGLLSLGIDWTLLRRSRWPDHGLFAHGASRLYVHRGTGFYGFPMRVGVPGELSVLDLLWES